MAHRIGVRLGSFLVCAAIVAAAIGFAATSVRAAKATLTVYTAVEADDLKKYAARFNEDYPDIEIKWVRDSTGVITAKLLAEKANPQADVIWGLAATSLLVLKPEGMLMPYAPKGVERLDAQFRDGSEGPMFEIEVLRWSWGMQAKSSLGGGTATGKASVRELTVVKRIDSASTALMSALRTNEPIQKAILTLRKAGKSQLEYLKVTIEQGRVTALDVEAGDGSGGSGVTESVRFSFNKINVEYVPQGKDGQAMGGTIYSDQWGDG